MNDRDEIDKSIVVTRVRDPVWTIVVVLPEVDRTIDPLQSFEDQLSRACRSAQAVAPTFVIHVGVRRRDPSPNVAGEGDVPVRNLVVILRHRS